MLAAEFYRLSHNRLLFQTKCLKMLIPATYLLKNLNSPKLEKFENKDLLIFYWDQPVKTKKANVIRGTCFLENQHCSTSHFHCSTENNLIHDLVNITYLGTTNCFSLI